MAETTKVVNLSEYRQKRELKIQSLEESERSWDFYEILIPTFLFGWTVLYLSLGFFALVNVFSSLFGSGEKIFSYSTSLYVAGIGIILASIWLVVPQIKQSLKK